MIKSISITVLSVSSIFLISCYDINNSKYIENTEKIEQNKVNKLNFYKTSEEKYFFSDVEVTKDQWDMLTKQFFFNDTKGNLQIQNEIQWTILNE